MFTPVYNGEDYLDECIESVLGQTYTNFEYIIADNASSDSSLAIARKYEERDRRVRVVAHAEHLSNHLAHWNRALGAIAPEATYVKFVLADDWLFAQCLELMVRVAEPNTSVGLVSAYRLDDDRVNLDGLPPSTTVLPGRDVARSFLLAGPLPFLFGSPSSVLVRADLVRKRHRFYNEDNIHADTEVCLDVLTESDFGFVHQVLTYTRRHNEAITSRVRPLGTYVPADLGMFQRWGPVFLAEDEYDRKLVVRLAEYAAFLSARPMSWAQRGFRDYHRTRLREFLGGTSSRQLARGLRLEVRHSLAKAVARPGAGASAQASH